MRLNDLNYAAIYAKSKKSLTDYKEEFKKKGTPRRETFTLFKGESLKSINLNYIRSESAEEGYLSENNVRKAILNHLFAEMGIEAISPQIYSEAVIKFNERKVK